MTAPDSDVIKAIFTALDGNITVDSVVVTTHDSVPQDTDYPYIVIDNMSVQPDDPIDSRRDERVVILSVWSQYRGQKQVLDIFEVIDTLIHNQKLAMDSGRMVNAKVVDKRTVRDADNITFMGRVKLKIITEH